MPLNREDWMQTLADTQQDCASAQVLVQAIARGKVVPVGIDPEDERYHYDMPDDVRADLNAKLAQVALSIKGNASAGIDAAADVGPLVAVDPPGPPSPPVIVPPGE